MKRECDDYLHDLIGEPPGPLPAQPCEFPSGSAERIAELTARAARRETLFHPGDSRTVGGRNNRNTGTGLYVKRVNREVR